MTQLSINLDAMYKRYGVAFTSCSFDSLLKSAEALGMFPHAGLIGTDFGQPSMTSHS